jgi:hypothetical protein
VYSGEWRVSQCGITNVLAIIPLAALSTINYPLSIFVLPFQGEIVVGN